MSDSLSVFIAKQQKQNLTLHASKDLDRRDRASLLCRMGTAFQ